MWRRTKHGIIYAEPPNFDSKTFTIQVDSIISRYSCTWNVHPMTEEHSNPQLSSIVLQLVGRKGLEVTERLKCVSREYFWRYFYRHCLAVNKVTTSVHSFFWTRAFHWHTSRLMTVSYKPTASEWAWCLYSIYHYLAARPQNLETDASGQVRRPTVWTREAHWLEKAIFRPTTICWKRVFKGMYYSHLSTVVMTISGLQGVGETSVTDVDSVVAG